MNRIVLASQSVGRRMLFERYFDKFEIHPAYVDEEKVTGKPSRIVVKLSILKAKKVSEIFPEDFVCGFDTVVVCNGKVVGKPKDREEAKEYLKFLSGKIQSVYSGFCIVNKKINLFKYGYSKALLKFAKVSDEWIEEYVKNNPVTLFAGGYAIQNNDRLIKILWGDRDTIIGAPMKKVLKILNIKIKNLWTNF